MVSPLEDLVTHKFININGVNLHYVEAGSGPTVLLLHGFPDIWYGFHRQIPALVAAGFHLLIPDLRGFGQTDVPDNPDEYTSSHVVGDLIGLLDTLQVKQTLVVGHHWGAVYANSLLLFRQDRVKGVVLLALPYFPRGVGTSPPAYLTPPQSDNFYVKVFQKPGVAEEIFKTAKNEDIMSAFLLRWNHSDNLVVPRFIVNEPLPEWLTKEDLKVYAEAFDKSGWTGGFNHYRAAVKNWQLMAPWVEAPLPPHVPVLTLIGEEDITMKMFAIRSPAFKEMYGRLVPNSKGVHIIDGSHFLHQEKHEVVNKYIINFLQEFKK